MRIGSLFSGAGMLDYAVAAVFGGEVVWHSEIDPAASKVLAHRFPGVPNLGSVNSKGNPRLNPAFSEWMMGWPSGWVTDSAIGISRNDQLRIVGNGVCPQQAAAALRYLLAVAA